MVDYEVRELIVPGVLLEIIKEQKQLSDVSPEEFFELVSSGVFETFVSNSIHSKQITKNRGDVFNSVYIHKEFINDLIAVYQQLKRKISSGDSISIVVGKIEIPSSAFERMANAIFYIVLTNNINFLKGRAAIFSKYSEDDDAYMGALNLAVGVFTSKLLDFDVNRGNDIKTYVSLFVDAETKTIQNEDEAIRFPKEMHSIKRILDQIQQTSSENSHDSYRDLLIKALVRIESCDVSLVAKIGELYFYILGYGTVTKNTFLKQVGWSSDDSIFSTNEGIILFQKNILPFIESNNGSDYLLTRIKKISEVLEDMGVGIDRLDREMGDENDSFTLADMVAQDGFTNPEILVQHSSNMDLFDREIRLTKKPNVDFTLLERIIAGTCINEYFTFAEFRELLKEYGELKGVGDKYVERFHKYLSLFNFSDKSDWYQYDNEKLDALIFEQMGDIFDFSKEYALKVYNGLKTKFDDFYGPHGTVFLKYDTSYHGKTKTFKDNVKIIP